MTAPALPPEVESHVVAVDALLDAVRKFVKKDTPTGLMRLNDAMVAARDSTAALRTAIARALGGDGEPVAWGVFDKNDCLWRSFDSQRDAERESASLNAREDTGHYRACGPYRVEPLSFTRPAATGDTGEVQRARAAFYEAAREAQEIAVEAASQLPLSGEEQAAVAEARKKRSDAYRALIKAERAATGGPDAR